MENAPYWIGPLVRIVLRYGSGFLIAAGMLPEEIAMGIVDDPDVLLIAGIVVGAAAEAAYALAKKNGNPT